jgi:hypothetical protein
MVSTIRLPATALEPGLLFATHITAIVADGPTLYLADGYSIMRLNPDDPTAFSYTVPELVGDAIAPHVITSAGNADAGNPFGLTMLGDTVAYTDPVLHALRTSTAYVDAPLGPAPAENADFISGDFRDGDAGLVDAPLGIAAFEDDAVVFADSGNRRVRAVRNIDTRHVSAADVATDPFGRFHDATKYYRVLYVGTPDDAYDVPFSESVAGRLEARLHEHAATLELAGEPKVAIVRPSTVATCFRI